MTTSDRIAASYDAVAQTYAEKIGDEMAGKPIDRAWLNCLAELAPPGGVVADVGCGPGHVAAYLAGQGKKVMGVDLSPGMIRVARNRYPQLEFMVGSLLELPVGDNAWAAAVCPYSILHLADEERPAAFAELARAIVPSGWLLLSFHISGENHEPGQVSHVEKWWDNEVDLDFHFLSPDVISQELTAAGFQVIAVTQRQPWPGVEQPTRRCHLLAQAPA